MMTDRGLTDIQACSDMPVPESLTYTGDNFALALREPSDFAGLGVTHDRQNQDTCFRGSAQERRNALNRILPTQILVKDDDIGLRAGGQRQRVSTRRGFAHDRDTWLTFEEHPQARTHNPMVI